MAIEINLRLQTSISPEEIINFIVHQEGFEKSIGDGNFYAKGLIGWVNLIDKIVQKIIFEENGILANVNIRCWNDYENYEVGMQNILKIFLLLLKNINGDAVIEHDSGFVNLVRKNNKIIVNTEAFSDDEEALWRLKDIPFHYEVKEITHI